MPGLEKRRFFLAFCTQNRKRSRHFTSRTGECMKELCWTPSVAGIAAR
jgi:hypothetical protein